MRVLDLLFKSAFQMHVKNSVCREHFQGLLMEESCPKSVLLPLRLEAARVLPSKYREILGLLILYRAGQGRAGGVPAQEFDTCLMNFRLKPLMASRKSNPNWLSE